MEDQLLAALAIIFFLVYVTIFAAKIFNIFTKGKAFNLATFATLSILYLLSWGMNFMVTLISPNETTAMLLYISTGLLIPGLILTIIEWAWTRGKIGEVFGFVNEKEDTR